MMDESAILFFLFWILLHCSTMVFTVRSLVKYGVGLMLWLWKGKLWRVER